MIDIRLISIVPTPGVQQSGSISQGSSSNSPPALVSFPPGSVLSGFIVNRDANGNPILRTDKGDLTFQSNIFLKIGTEVTLRVENRNGNLLAHLLTIDGQPPETFAAQQHVSDDSGAVVLPKFSDLEEKLANLPTTFPRSQTTGIQPAQQTVISDKPTLTVSGILLTPQTTEPDAPEPPPLVFRITSLQTPENPVQQAAYAAYSRATGALTPLVTPPVSTSGTAPPSTPQLLVVGQTFTAPVIALEPTGEPLIQTPAGLVRLQGIQLQQGAQVTLEVLPPQTPLSRPVSPPPAPLPELAKQWTSLQQITTILSAHPGAPLPAWFTPLTHSTTTPPSSQEMSSGLMVFVTALRGGSFTNWLGDETVQWLKQNEHEPLLKKAETEFNTLVRAFTTPTAQTNQWQSLFFPVAVDGNWQQVRMFLKRERRQNKKLTGSADDDTRFIVEMSMSQLGELQLDGLVHRATGGVQFDLFIRSLSPLEAAIQQDILRIYGDIGAITGYRGQLVFQAVREFPVNPMKEAMASSGSVVA